VAGLPTEWQDSTVSDLQFIVCPRAFLNQVEKALRSEFEEGLLLASDSGAPSAYDAFDLAK